MTSRERVRALINRQLPDRIPNGLGACETEGLHIVAYDTLQKVLGVSPQPPRLDTFMTNAVFELPVIQAMEGDMILLASPNMCQSPLRGDIFHLWKEQSLWGKTFRVSTHEKFRQNPDGSIVWESAGGAVCPANTFFFDHSAPTNMMADFDVPDPDQFHPRDTLSDEALRQLETAARQLYEETELSICLGESITDLQVAPGGMIGSMILMKEEPDIMRAFIEKCADAGLKQLELLEQAVGKYVDILSIAHDFGDNRCVMIGDVLWREIYKSSYARFFQGWKQRTHMAINFHSCGAISSILGDLIECGVDIFNPVQTSANGMSALSLKERFGKDIIFWGGGYDAQLLPASASYETVYQAVSQAVKTLGAGGGYIFSGVHNLPANLPAHHLQAMLDAWRDTRDYT